MHDPQAAKTTNKDATDTAQHRGLVHFCFTTADLTRRQANVLDF